MFVLSPQAPLEKGGSKDHHPNYEEDYLKERGLIFNGYHLPYNPDNIENAKKLRKTMTNAEKTIWYELFYGGKFEKMRFLRQKPIDNFIVDFYCAKLKLAIEIDGEIHLDQREYDQMRTELLELYGVTVVRYSNDDVLNNLDFVKKDLKQIIKKITQKRK